jgi:hypothetical protein
MQRSTDTPISKLPVGRATSGSEPPLVVPHPLDFDWRFTGDTIGLIWQTIRELAHPQTDVALLGTPSLAAAVELWKELGSVTLHERNPNHHRSLSQGIIFACCDVLRDPISPASNGVVVADPPWYEAETIGFLWTASILSRTGGHVLLSLPPVATRPGIKEERERITAAAAGLGLEFLRLSDGVLRYGTPFFETNAMQAAGSPVTNDWRIGDLAVFRRTEGKCGQRPIMDSELAWMERSLGLTRFKLQQTTSTGFASPVLHTLVPGDVLPSVSRRDPRRKDATVWTSGNRIFGCDGTATLAAIIDGINAGKAPEVTVGMQQGRTLTSNERILVATAIHQVRNVVKWESAEFRDSDAINGISKLGPNRHRAITLERAG